ncbi:unnamed protein product [Amoebophrya sp. A120]|nr:unnamed protein product [Amoebophrya sp. A120]|eukprot:GSA120T00023492001.1
MSLRNKSTSGSANSAFPMQKRQKQREGQVLFRIRRGFCDLDESAITVTAADLVAKTGRIRLKTVEDLLKKVVVPKIGTHRVFLQLISFKSGERLPLVTPMAYILNHVVNVSWKKDATVSNAQVNLFTEEQDFLPVDAVLLSPEDSGFQQHYGTASASASEQEEPDVDLCVMVTQKALNFEWGATERGLRVKRTPAAAPTALVCSFPPRTTGTTSPAETREKSAAASSSGEVKAASEESSARKDTFPAGGALSTESIPEQDKAPPNLQGGGESSSPLSAKAGGKMNTSSSAPPNSISSPNKENNSSSSSPAAAPSSAEEVFQINVTSEDADNMPELIGILLEDAITCLPKQIRATASGAELLQKIRASVWKNLPFDLVSQPPYLKLRYRNMDSDDDDHFDSGSMRPTNLFHVACSLGELQAVLEMLLELFEELKLDGTTLENCVKELCSNAFVEQTESIKSSEETRRKETTSGVDEDFEELQGAGGAEDDIDGFMPTNETSDGTTSDAALQQHLLASAVITGRVGATATYNPLSSAESGTATDADTVLSRRELQAEGHYYSSTMGETTTQSEAEQPLGGAAVKVLGEEDGAQRSQTTLNKDQEETNDSTKGAKLDKEVLDANPATTTSTAPPNKGRGRRNNRRGSWKKRQKEKEKEKKSKEESRWQTLSCGKERQNITVTDLDLVLGLFFSSASDQLGVFRLLLTAIKELLKHKKLFAPQITFSDVLNATIIVKPQESNENKQQHKRGRNRMNRRVQRLESLKPVEYIWVNGKIQTVEQEQWLMNENMKEHNSPEGTGSSSNFHPLALLNQIVNEEAICCLKELLEFSHKQTQQSSSSSSAFPELILETDFQNLITRDFAAEYYRSGIHTSADGSRANTVGSADTHLLHWVLENVDEWRLLSLVKILAPTYARKCRMEQRKYKADHLGLTPSSNKANTSSVVARGPGSGSAFSTAPPAAKLEQEEDNSIPWVDIHISSRHDPSVAKEKQAEQASASSSAAQGNDQDGAVAKDATGTNISAAAADAVPAEPAKDETLLPTSSNNSVVKPPSPNPVLKDNSVCSSCGNQTASAMELVTETFLYDFKYNAIYSLCNRVDNFQDAEKVVPVLRCLHKNGVNLKAKNNMMTRETALHKLAKRSWARVEAGARMVEELSRLEPSLLSCKNLQGLTPLHLWAQHTSGHYGSSHASSSSSSSSSRAKISIEERVLHALLPADKFELCEPCGHDQRTVLHRLATRGLAWGGRSTWTDADTGASTWSLAGVTDFILLRAGRECAVNLLNARDCKQRTALVLACKRGHDEIVRYLLPRMNLRGLQLADLRKKTAYLYAVRSVAPKEVLYAFEKRLANEKLPLGCKDRETKAELSEVLRLNDEATTAAASEEQQDVPGGVDLSFHDSDGAASDISANFSSSQNSSDATSDDDDDDDGDDDSDFSDDSDDSSGDGGDYDEGW